MEIKRLPALVDNYIFLIHDPQTHTAIVVDPAEANPVLECLEQVKAKLVAIFNTHHHHDHIGANRELLSYFPELVIYGGAEDRGRIPEQRVFLQEGDRLEFARREIEILFVPGHTRAHIAYYFPPTTTETMGELFCGDTLFAGGCGRLFEGTPTQMVASLTKLRNLPENTRIWCAHEYTLKNLEFALTIEPENQALQTRYAQVQGDRCQGLATIPTNLGLEKRTNPFLRWDVATIASAMGSTDPARVFGRLRGKKDLF